MFARRRTWVGPCAVLIGVLGCTTGATQPNGGTTYNLDNTTPPTETIVDAGDELATPPNGPAACPTGGCNYQTQAGCGESDAASCIPAVSPGGAVLPTCIQSGGLNEGEECSRWGDCGRGLICADRVCRRLCCGRDWSACAADQRCVASLSISGDLSPLPTGAYVCVPANGCDALNGAPCAAGTVCQIVDPTGATACVPAPQPGAGARAADPCPCQTGFTCVGQGCRRLCSVSPQGGVTCPPEEGQCVHWQRDPEGVGECTPVY